MRAVEKALVGVTAAPWHAGYLVPTGFAILATFDALFGADGSLSSLLLVFFGALLALRLAPAMLRRALPVSREVHSAWFRHRVLAKNYDSYQWQKLLWIGAGMATYLVFSAHRDVVQAGLTVGSIVAGTIGMALWRRVRMTDDAIPLRTQHGR